MHEIRVLDGAPHFGWGLYTCLLNPTGQLSEMVGGNRDSCLVSRKSNPCQLETRDVTAT